MIKIYKGGVLVSDGSVSEHNTSETAHGDIRTTLSEKVDKVAGKGLSDENYTLAEKSKVANVPENTVAQLADKVDKITGKGLSTEDYTTAEKAKVANIPLDTNAQLADIASNVNDVHFNGTEYIGLGGFWNAQRTGKIYTVRFNQFSVSQSPLGTKLDDNMGLICEPSTNAAKGRNDYENIGLFRSIEVNAYVDENDDYHVTAIKGDSNFRRDGTNGDVYIMAMSGYIKRNFTDDYWEISYSDFPYEGFEVIHEAEKPDGTIRPYLLHAKYAAGRNPNEGNNLASISGVYPEYIGMSHNGQITAFAAKGAQYSGKTSHDDFYIQLMMWLKYATTISDNVMKGCQSYYVQYSNRVAETGVNRVVVSNAEGSYLLIGSTVSIGNATTADRANATVHNIANRVKITAIKDVGGGNSAVYVDSAVFDTTLSTKISTMPWNSGGCDDVLGQDGSPYNNLSGKEPFIINGIEVMVGGYEVIQNLIINNDNSGAYKIEVYACYDCHNYATSITSNYDLVGHQLAQTNNTWQYISKIAIGENNPSVIVPIEAAAGSTTGFGDGLYTNAPVTATRVWLSFGHLHNGVVCGLRCLAGSASLAGSSWNILSRLSATGRTKRRVN